MTARDWMQIAALTSTLGLTGAAIAQSTEGTTSTEYTASELTSSMDTPSSGAIVTPEDKALGLGKDNARAGNRNGDVNDDTSTLNGNTLNDDESSVMEHDSTSTLNENGSAATGSNVRPRDMWPGNVRGQ